MKLYIVAGEMYLRGARAYYLLTEAGEPLASHICSDAGYALGDLEGRRPDRQARWRERFGDYQVLTIGDDDLTKEELTRRHNAWASPPPGAGES